MSKGGVTFTVRGRDIKVSAKDQDRITAIVCRAVDDLVTIFLRGNLVDLMADLALCHRRYHLDLDGLLAAGKDEFMREITFINRHIDRRTGKMPEGLMPRFLAKQEAVV
jgi:hypothetical protein